MEHKSYILTRLENTFSERDSHSLVSVLFEDIPNLDTYIIDEVEQIISRIIEGEPIQYVTGRAPFYGYFFDVNEHVLIPRPETEELVYTIERHIKKEGLESCRILDIGTGSGCIPITLSKLFPSAKIFGLDVSDDALKVARNNNTKLKANVHFLALDILNETNWKELGDFDIIVSNPPYIPNIEKGLMEANVLDYEPHIALFVEDTDPLIFYRTIFSMAESISKSADIFLECNEYNAVEVGQIFSNFYNVELIKDLQQKDRIVKAIRNKIR